MQSCGMAFYLSTLESPLLQGLLPYVLPDYTLIIPLIGLKTGAKGEHFSRIHLFLPPLAFRRRGEFRKKVYWVSPLLWLRPLPAHHTVLPRRGIRWGRLYPYPRRR